MHFKYLPLLCVFLCPLVGCGDVQRLSQDLDGSAQATYWFWVRLQGIQYRGNEKTQRIYQGNLSSAKAANVDAVASGFSRAASQHDQMARELQALSAENADGIAIDYRDQLVTAHENLQDKFRELAEATKQRDAAAMKKSKQDLESLLKSYRQTWDERQAVMSKLKEKFDRDFDYIE